MSELMHLASVAASTLLASRRLAGNPKVSAESFQTAARGHAGIDQDRLDDVKAAYERSTNAALKSTVRQLSRMFWQPQLPSFPGPDRLGKMVSICESKGFEFGCSEAGIEVKELAALAVALAIQSHGDRFGQHDSLTELRAEHAGLRAKLDDLIAKMKSAYRADDLRMQPPNDQPLKNAIPAGNDPEFKQKMTLRAKEQFNNERQTRRRPAGPWLRAAPHISLVSEEWPAELIEHLLSTDPSNSAAAAVEEAEANLAKAEGERKASEENRAAKRVRIARRTIDEATA